MAGLLDRKLHVVNVGLASFADAAASTGAGITRVDWSPPAQGDPQAARCLAGLIRNPDIDQANGKAFSAYAEAQPVLEGLGVARDCIPGMEERTILHAGPPITWERMCGPMRGAIVGAIVFEGWADDTEGAFAMTKAQEIQLAPCHHHDAVGPMAGIISPSMPVWIVRNAEGGNRGFSNLNEGLGKALRFGANGAEVIARLSWMRSTLAPALQAALKFLGEIELKPPIAQALHMGDEAHNRNAAASGLLLKKLAPAILRSEVPAAEAASVIDFLAGNEHFFLNLSMAASKVMVDAARRVVGSTMVTAMCRNGVEFGIRVSGTGDAWFTAPAPVVDGLYFPGYGIADAAADLGDSAITETAGLGGFAMAAAPAIVKFVGGTSADALAASLEMGHITIGRNPVFTLPALDFAGTPSGIDARKVADTGILPIINTGIAHKEAGIGQIGAGVTRAPMACFSQALLALARLLRC